MTFISLASSGECGSLFLWQLAYICIDNNYQYRYNGGDSKSSKILIRQ